MATALALAYRLFGSSLAASVANPSSLDLMQVIDEGGKIVWNLSKSGVASTNPASPTPLALIARFYGSSFANAFKNQGSIDLLQVMNQSGGIVFHVTSTGLAVTP